MQRGGEEKAILIKRVCGWTSGRFQIVIKPVVHVTCDSRQEAELAQRPNGLSQLTTGHPLAWNAEVRGILCQAL